MSIAIIGTLPCNKLKKWIYVSFLEDGDSVDFTGTVPADLADIDIQNHVDSIGDIWRFGALNRMYPGAKPLASTVESFRSWVALGHKNTVEVNGEIVETVIDKVPWQGRHPDRIYQLASLDFMDRFTPEEAAAAYGSTDINVKIILSKMSAARQIDFRNQTLIDSVSYLVSVSILSQARAEEIMTR